MSAQVRVDRDCPTCSNGFLYFARQEGNSELVVECEECLGVWQLLAPECLGPGYGPFVSGRERTFAAGDLASLGDVQAAGYGPLVDRSRP